MKWTLSFLLVLSTLSTVAFSAAAQVSYPADVVAEDQADQTAYETIAKGVAQMKEPPKIDLTLTTSTYPYYDWMSAHTSEFFQYWGLANWLAGTTVGSLTCGSNGPSAETADEISARENLASTERDPSRTFEIGDYVKSLPGFVDCGLSTAEYGVIFDYTAGFYQSLNVQLRKGNADGAATAFTATLTRALSKIANYTGPVFRGSNFTAGMKKRYTVGQIVSDPGFVSTSTKYAFSATDHITIVSKTGKYIAPLSANHMEEEVLFLPNAKFKITNVEVDATNALVTNYTMEEQ